MSATSEPSSVHSIQILTDELELLKAEQAKAMGTAIYLGMTKEEAKLCDERRKRILELYELLLRLLATHS